MYLCLKKHSLFFWDSNLTGHPILLFAKSGTWSRWAASGSSRVRYRHGKGGKKGKKGSWPSKLSSALGTLFTCHMSRADSWGRLHQWEYFSCTSLDLEDVSFSWLLTIVYSAHGFWLSTLLGGHFSPFQMIPVGGEVLKATYWQLSSTDSNQAHRKPHPGPTNPWKCWPSLPFVLLPDRLLQPAFGLRTCFFKCESFTKLWDCPPKLQWTPIILLEGPLSPNAV